MVDGTGGRLRVPAELDAFEVQVATVRGARDELLRLRATWELAPADAPAVTRGIPLPQSMTIVRAPSESSGLVRVTVLGLRNGAVVQRIRRLWAFGQGAIELPPFELIPACFGIECPEDEACAQDGVCHPLPCVGGSCPPPGVCGYGSVLCGDSCVPETVDDCGTCGHSCRDVANGAGTCLSGTCAISGCDAGWADCDGVVANGCEAVPPFTDVGGGDHCGADWAPAGPEVGGAHTRVGVLTVPVGTTLRVRAFDGTSGGTLRVEAREIRVDGTIDASGSGPAGGDGGDGKGSSNPYCGGTGAPGAAGGGAFGGGGGGGGAGNGGTSETAPSCRYANGEPGDAGRRGGYAASETNGDSTMDDSLSLGSGGGAGGGGGAGSRFGSNNNYPAGTGGGGGGGGRGGGAVALVASDTVQVGGSVLTRGLVGGAPGAPGQRLDPCGAGDRYVDPGGGRGGSGATSGSGAGGARACADVVCGAGGVSNTCGGSGGSGAPGAGGGILLLAPKIVLLAGATLDASGGADTGNGGTVKVFASERIDRERGSTIAAGRVVPDGI